MSSMHPNEGPTDRRSGVLGQVTRAVGSKLHWTKNRRANAMIAMSAVMLAVVIAALAMVLLAAASRLETRRAEQRANLGADLLVTVGGEMPNLVRSSLRPGLGLTHDRTLDTAVAIGQRQHVLSNLTIWDSHGRIVYSRGPGRGVEHAAMAAVGKALRGVDGTVVDSAAFDPTTNRRTGTLDAYEPLRDEQGHIFGVIDTSLPLAPIKFAMAAENSRIVITLAVGAGLLWLLLLPVTARGAYAINHSWVPGRRRLLREFRRGLGANEIELLYQPQIDPQHGGLVAVEALVRWRRGGWLQSPDSFLPAIESTPLMSALTDRVVELALCQLAEWRRTGDSPRVSVNLSATDLADEKLPGRIAAALNRHGVPGDQLTVEVTETAILEDRACAARVLNAINTTGVDIAVDDFGTGHASIARLHDFPVREVKIDRSFVGLADERERSYLTAIVRFCQSLGFRVVAEGVEDGDTLVYLRALGCDLVQGYRIAKPLPAAEIPRWRSQGALLSTPAAAAVAA